MSANRPLSRRSALAGLGAGSLGLFLGAAASAAPSAFETGGSGGGDLVPTAATTHPLTGLWLSHIALNGDGDATAAAPAFFGADGTAVLVYPCAEASENGTQIRGLALGTWAPIDDKEARFTAVQVCFGADGSYQGTRTYDGYPVVSDDGASFTVKGEFELLTVRDAGNAIVESRSGGRPMIGTRMSPGHAGFPSFRTSDSPENDLAPVNASDTTAVPEVAPVHPGDPPGDPRLIPVPAETETPGDGPGSPTIHQ